MSRGCSERSLRVDGIGDSARESHILLNSHFLKFSFSIKNRRWTFAHCVFICPLAVSSKQFSALGAFRCKDRVFPQNADNCANGTPIAS
jgi:hypothetical protein